MLEAESLLQHPIKNQGPAQWANVNARNDVSLTWRIGVQHEASGPIFDVLITFSVARANN